MKNTYKLLIIFCIGLFSSCESELDINNDPNFPAEINSGLALTAAEASIAVVMGGELTNLGGFYTQYHTQAPSASQYENIDSYNLNTAYANDIWTELYAGCLNDLKYVTEESTASEDTATLLMAEVLRAYTYQLLVDLFDDVPYSEALNGPENITPIVDSGEEIYADLIAKMDAAVATYNANPTEALYPSQDILFRGDIDKWIQFANTLKLKMYLRMAYTPAANPAAVTALLAEGNFLTEDAKFTNFDDTVNKRNPFYENVLSQTGLGGVNHVASNTLAGFYSENEDPRLRAVFTPSTSGTYASIAQGTGNDFNNTASAYARPNIRPNTPVFFISLAEIYFLQAEALVRYSAGAGAKEMYDAGVLASFQTYQLNFFTDADPTDEEESPWTPEESITLATNFTSAGGAYEYIPTGVVEDDVRQIMVQKWAALPYVNNIEAWIESTRTKFPEVVAEGSQDYGIGNRIPSAISILSGVQVPSVLFYPDDEVNRNPNITQRTSVTENVWWDQKPE
ncbi:hypothetical protein AM493_10610 [Flavobacterium akiainvivens]|uniref:SusD/RagB family nutrient-binding outer membrane lipoprotein n=1 Tax=Flavobacterium akiainvivens TaxID=1202724 RepID=A0A0M8MDB7_9FLAO|nr:SusD/RagB family nutrient-binding outer membrane lipoprotein [Flavobacterium akiainvivens]KOS06434.1 hypothetical protein AM493_10610 [Flavobacterium akiainvivens]SFQ13629.1 Susd and RagB outer membrane lipoprotein [Flavobacterium akiainvivens]